MSAGEITTWLWDFGDGKTSKRQKARYVYRWLGNCVVSLMVSRPGGSDTVVKSEYITVARFPRQR